MNKYVKSIGALLAASAVVVTSGVTMRPTSKNSPAISGTANCTTKEAILHVGDRTILIDGKTQTRLINIALPVKNPDTKKSSALSNLSLIESVDYGVGPDMDGICTPDGKIDLQAFDSQAAQKRVLAGQIAAVLSSNLFGPKI